MSKKYIACLLTIFCCYQSAIAWEWWWEKKKTLEDKRLELQRRQIDDPTNPYINFNMGVAQYKKGQFDAAAGSFDRALQHVPDKPLFKKQVFYNLGQTEYRRALATVGPSWEKEKVSDELLDKAIEITEQSIKQFDAVLVLDTEHAYAKKMKEQVELFQKKLLAKKYENQQNKDQQKDQKNQQGSDNNKDKNQQQQGKEKDSQQSSGDDKKDGQRGDKGDKQADSDNDKDEQKDNKQDRQQQNKGTDQQKNNEDGQADKQKDLSGQDQQKDQQNKSDEQRMPEENKPEEQKQDHNKKQSGDDDQAKKRSEQRPNDAKTDEKKDKEEQGRAAGSEEDRQQEAEDAMDRVMNAHTKAVLDAVEQMEGNAQKRAMAYELSKMGAQRVGGNQKPW